MASPVRARQSEAALALQLSVEQLEQGDEVARLEQARFNAELALQQQADLRERNRLKAELAELAADLDASKEAQRLLAAELVQVRQGSEHARDGEGVYKGRLEDQLEASALALQAKEARWRQELDEMQGRASEAEQQVAQLRRSVDVQKEALRRAHEEAAAHLESERAADRRALKQAQSQLARAAAEADERLTAAREDGQAYVRQLERELAQARGELERVREERRAEVAGLQEQLRSAQEGARLVDGRTGALEEQNEMLRSQLGQLREVASDAQLERNRALDDARNLLASRDAARREAEGARAKLRVVRAREAHVSAALRQLQEEHSATVEQARQELLAQAEAHQVALATLKMRTADLRDENRRRTREVKDLRREVRKSKALPASESKGPASPRAPPFSPAVFQPSSHSLATAHSPGSPTQLGRFGPAADGTRAWADPHSCLIAVVSPFPPLCCASVQDLSLFHPPFFDPLAARCKLR